MTGVISKFVLSVAVAGAGGTAIGIPLSSSSKSITTNAIVTVEISQTPIDSHRSSNEETTPSQDSVSAVSTRETPSLTQAPEIQEVNSEGNQQLEETQSIVQSEGNCTVTLGLKKVIEELKLSDSDYIAFSCNGPDGSSDDTILTEKWTGIFPKKLLKRGDKLIQGKQLSIKTETEEPSDDDVEEIYTTRFHSSQFSTSDSVIVGKWKYGEEDYDDKTVDFVDLTSPIVTEKIYLVHMDD